MLDAHKSASRTDISSGGVGDEKCKYYIANIHRSWAANPHLRLVRNRISTPYYILHIIYYIIFVFGKQTGAKAWQEVRGLSLRPAFSVVFAVSGSLRFKGVISFAKVGSQKKHPVPRGRGWERYKTKKISSLLVSHDRGWPRKFRSYNMNNSAKVTYYRTPSQFFRIKVLI